MKVDRKGYISKIWIYKERRKGYVNNYKGKIPVSKTYRYKLFTIRISQWTKEIKRLDVRKNKINKILNAVNYFFCVNVESRSTKPEVVLARRIYFKIGLESGICGTHLARHIGRKHYDIASYNRNKLIQSFKTNPENKKAFHNFKRYFENK